MACIETDMGAYTAIGFDFKGSAEAKAAAQRMVKALKPFEADGIFGETLTLVLFRRGWTRGCRPPPRPVLIAG